jgi:hypothetical protein
VRDREKPTELRDARSTYKLRRDLTLWYKDYRIDLAIIGATPFMMIARKEKKYGVTSIYELDRIIDDK